MLIFHCRHLRHRFRLLRFLHFFTPDVSFFLFAALIFDFRHHFLLRRCHI